LRDERTFTEKLPIPSDKGVVLQVDNLQTDNIKITVRTNISEFNDMILIGHVRGIFNLQQIIQASQFTKKDGFREYTSDFPRSMFPTGIVHFTLFDQQSNPLCERLCFVNHHDNLTVEYKTDKPIYSQHERVILDITVKDKNNNPAITNLSLAVNANADAAKPVSENIQTYYLLTSDLTGRIENPAFYFKDDTPETRQALDCVMLTHGWRRFVWSEILKDRFPEFKHKIETTMSLTGSVSKDPSNASSGVSNVKLTILDDNREQYSTTSKPDGTFLFTGLEFYDTTNVKIEAVDNANKPRSYIDLDDEQMPDLPFLAENIINPQLFATRGIDVGMSNSSRVTNEADNENYTIYGTPDASIDLSKGDFDSYTNLLDVISGRVAGVSVQGGSVIIRGVNSINAGTEPLWLVDGITVDVSTVKSMHPLDVDRIDFLKGSSTAIYGARGANGVIAIYTRRGSFNRRTPGEFKLLGYHKVRQFYAPKYEDKLLQASFTKAIYWNPVITTDANGKARVSFNNTDNQQPLQFTIEGISTDGKLLFTQ